MDNEIVNVDLCLQHVKNELTTTLATASNSLIKKLEDDIRNNVIQQLTSNNLITDNEYGKMTDDDIKLFMESHKKNFTQTKECKGCLNRRDGSYHNIYYNYNNTIIDTNTKALYSFLNTIIQTEKEYIIHIQMMNMIRYCNQTYDGNNRCGDYHNNLKLLVWTNKCNLYIYSSYGPQKVIYNMLLNKIFIDIIKSFMSFITITTDISGQSVYSKEISNQFEQFEKIHKVIAELVKKYWSSELFGNHAIKYERTYNELQNIICENKELRDTLAAKNYEISNLTNKKDELKSDISDWQQLLNVKTTEITNLKNQNEELKKQLAELEMFKRCMQMVQSQTRSTQPLTSVDSPVSITTQAAHIY